jgi:hypothetical protein
MTLNLSDDEVAQVTGYVIPAWQIKWLRAQEWKFVVSRVGKPIISRRYYEQQMGVVSNDADLEPDFSIFHEAA